jgi:hypothetical protein
MNRQRKVHMMRAPLLALIILGVLNIAIIEPAISWSFRESGASNLSNANWVAVSVSLAIWIIMAIVVSTSVLIAQEFVARRVGPGTDRQALLWAVRLAGLALILSGYLLPIWAVDFATYRVDQGQGTNLISIGLVTASPICLAASLIIFVVCILRRKLTFGNSR